MMSDLEGAIASAVAAAPRDCGYTINSSLYIYIRSSITDSHGSFLLLTLMITRLAVVYRYSRTNIDPKLQIGLIHATK